MILEDGHVTRFVVTLYADAEMLLARRSHCKARAKGVRADTIPGSRFFIGCWISLLYLGFHSSYARKNLSDCLFHRISGLHWEAFWLYNVYRFANKRAVFTWKNDLNSKWTGALAKAGQGGRRPPERPFNSD
jgi:hypothetical protein